MKNLETNIIDDKSFIEAYSISEDVESQVKSILKYLLTIHHCIDIFPPIYASVKELIINAIKANYKNIYFENYSPKNNSDTLIPYEIALKLFKLELNRENARYLEKIARKNNMKAEIEIWTNNNTLHICVINPVNMTDIELGNIHRKLLDADQCKDIAEYFIKNSNDPNREGAGLGLILIMMMLKSLKAPEDSLIISSVNNKTTAYLKIPLINEVQNCA